MFIQYILKMYKAKISIVLKWRKKALLIDMQKNLFIACDILVLQNSLLYWWIRRSFRGDCQ